MQLPLLAIVCFLGLPSGMLLARLAKEEIVEYSKYIEIARKGILLLILLVIAYALFLVEPLVTIAGIIAGTLLGSSLSTHKEMRYDYLYFGLLVATTGFLSALFLLSVFVFLYGLCYGCIFEKLKDKRVFLAHIVCFFVPFLVLLLPILHGFVFGFAGCCLMFLFKST